MVCSIVLFSFFDTSQAKFKFWNNPSSSTGFINSTNIPVGFKSDISLFSLFFNFFSNHEFISIIKDDVIVYNDVLIKTNGIVNDKKIILEKENNFYSVQFAVLDVSLDYFPGVGSFETYLKNGFIHYIVNGFPSISSAKQKMFALRELGFSDAFVYTLEDDVRQCFFIVNKENTDINSLYLSDKKEVSNFDEILVLEPDHDVRTLENNELVNTEIKELAHITLDKLDELDNLVKDESLNADNILISSFANEKLIEKDALGKVKYSLDNDGYPIKSDEQVISDSPFIRKDAKDLILESIDNGSISIIDVEALLFEYAGKLIMKRNVKEFIGKRR